MLAQIKRKDELERVNRKFGKQPTEDPMTPSKLGSETILQKTTNLMDEAEIALLGGGELQEEDSNLLGPIR